MNSLIAAPVIAYLLARDGRLNAVRAQAASSLGLLSCVKAIADLALAMNDRNRPGCADVREAARMALQRLLPLVGPQYCGTLPVNTEAEVCKLLGQPPSDLHVPALNALEHIGATRSLATVTKLATEADQEATRVRAAEVLPMITERAARLRDVALLLRPAAAPGAPEDVLLRPVEVAPSGDVGLLVRPVGGEPEPAVIAATPDDGVTLAATTTQE
ncbi:MAG: hypothetical protein FJX72_00605 [Armatimonadetes bacterium]|nr:hypothetical protein [Armatimonadota bacterium]